MRGLRRSFVRALIGLWHREDIARGRSSPGVYRLTRGLELAPVIRFGPWRFRPSPAQFRQSARDHSPNSIPVCLIGGWPRPRYTSRQFLIFCSRQRRRSKQGGFDATTGLFTLRCSCAFGKVPGGWSINPAELANHLDDPTPHPATADRCNRLLRVCGFRAVATGGVEFGG